MFGFSIIMILALVSLSASTENCKDGKTEDVCVAEPFNQTTDWDKATSIYQFHANDINGKNISLEKYREHVLIVVNVASQCGLTAKNYKQLEALYEKYGASHGLRILAFPSNQFASQEPGTSLEILDFIKQYNVQFDMFEKVDVNGDKAHPLWKWLKRNSNGFITEDVKWNFSKFVINKQGQVVDRFSPTTEPFSLDQTLVSLF